MIIAYLESRSPNTLQTERFNKSVIRQFTCIAPTPAPLLLISLPRSSPAPPSPYPRQKVLKINKPLGTNTAFYQPEICDEFITMETNNRTELNLNWTWTLLNFNTHLQKFEIYLRSFRAAIAKINQFY